ncbi:hypothetical protein [Variovorax sp.]|uniref:hypothetical protein n=1 Tax=Variovorax sp. TaxID=1871043 RepID=UPI003BA8F8C3
MTTPAPAEPAASREQGPTKNRDPFLGLLISYIQGDTGELPITLAINGMLISGRIISSHAYFDGMAETIAASLFGNDESPTRAVLVESISSLPGDRNDPEIKEVDSLHFIHLRNVRFMDAAGQMLNLNGAPLWRGRLTEVAGWSFGAFEKS